MIYKNELGMYLFENNGFIDCDGITIDNLKGFGIDFLDDEITVQHVEHVMGITMAYVRGKNIV